jgi:hypothetical protein
MSRIVIVILIYQRQNLHIALTLQASTLNVDYSTRIWDPGDKPDGF